MTGYFNAELIEKYRMSGPRYTSYPTAVQFTPEFTNDDHIAHLKKSNQTQTPLSLYLHIPFCEHVCYFCGCNKIITRNHKKAGEYLDHLETEILRQKNYITTPRTVKQLHYGGGTPTFLSLDEQKRLMALLKKEFNFAKDGEYSIEIDPRTIDYDYLKTLRELGFNRVSFGVQDFDYEVQKAVNRIQSHESVARLIHAARELKFESISVDLIYGLPYQNTESFNDTLNKIINLEPDRLAIFNYAHMPELFGAQRQIPAHALPDAPTKLRLLELSINKLTQAGYVFIGLDHFAKPDDSLVKHQEQGTLYRNFQGYSTFSDCDLLGFGISSISQINNAYSQNQKARDRYYKAIDNQELAIARGITLSQDDIIRREIITEIMCNLKLNLEKIAQKYQIDYKDYFKEEIKKLPQLAKDGLIDWQGQELHVLAPGRLLIRNIAMIFDDYLQQESTKKRFSQVI